MKNYKFAKWQRELPIKGIYVCARCFVWFFKTTLDSTTACDLKELDFTNRIKRSRPGVCISYGCIIIVLLRRLITDYHNEIF